MAKAHAIVHSYLNHQHHQFKQLRKLQHHLLVGMQILGTWVNVMVVAASASAIGATVAVATYQSSPIETRKIIYFESFSILTN